MRLRSVIAWVILFVIAVASPALLAADAPAKTRQKADRRAPAGKVKVEASQTVKDKDADAAQAAETAEPADEPEKTNFVRLARDDDDQPLALEVASVRFVPRDCGETAPTVDLIGAVHIGDKSYYRQLNELFAGYDAVLYEMVAPEEAAVPQPGAEVGNHPVALLQNAMTGVLNLEYQLRGVDYAAKNMVHADMSPEEFSATMRKRGESFLQMFGRMMAYALAQQSQETSGMGDTRFLFALLSKDRAMALKRIMAEQFEDLESSMEAIDGPEGSTIIGERNKVALGVLKREIAAGKKKLAIFYGAGHMVDFETRLRDDFDLVPVETRWLTAWDLRGKTSP